MTVMNCSLKPFNTFGIQANAANVFIAQSSKQLLEAWTEATDAKQPVLILGEGSNILLLEDFDGTVIINRIKGIQIKETETAWFLHVGAGENWHHLVEYTLQHGMPGLENLALIPGCAGSSPIQNIGAYGVEIKMFCDYVDCIELSTQQNRRLTNEDCQFSYRDSIFKHEYQGRFTIVAVGLRLPKAWQPVLNYGDLTKFNAATVTPQQILDTVCDMRMSKLPDPKINGNAGSFFKNPIITDKIAEQLLSRFPGIPHYPQTDGKVKLAAGWLIDQCQLKGHRIGGAAVHRQQALVIINEDSASSTDIVALARFVRQQVGEKFNIWLEPEVRFIGSKGEVNAVKTIM